MATWQHVFPKKKITCAHGVVDKLHPNGHRGTDYGLPVGVKILAITDGKVVLSEKHHNLGNVTVVKLHTGKYWYSVHMQFPGLPVGTVVATGDEVGKVGDTGAYCFGAHLHTGISDEKTGVYQGKVYDIVKYVDDHMSAPAPKAAPKVEAAPAAEVAPAAVVADPAPSVPAPAAEPAKKVSNEKWFTIKDGDTYESFAKRTSTKVADIKKLNDSKVLVAGEKIRIK